MFKGHSRAVRPRFSIAENVTKAPLKKGLFSDGCWKCNCRPRLPAQHFQTKNGGKNHGRWFYVCQLPQTKRCDFFLWDDEAKVREEAAVLNNSRNEPLPAPTTPLKDISHGLPSPRTERHIRFSDDDFIETPYTPSKPPRPSSVVHPQSTKTKNESQATTVAGLSDGDDEFFDWPATLNDNDEIHRVVESASQTAPLPPPETPRKTPKSHALDSPSRRRFDVPRDNNAPNGMKDDVFVTPATSRPTRLFNETAPPTPAETPSKIRQPDFTAAAESQLTSDILASLQNSLSVPLFSEAREDIRAICTKYNMQTRGITKGRDVLRDVVRKKDDQIATLHTQLEEMRSARETDRSVIAALRQELALQKQKN